jgi:hypothetical protein
MKSSKLDALFLFKNRLALGFSFLFVLGSSAVLSAEDGWISLEKNSDSALYKEKCGMCHLPGGMGVGILGRRMTPELALLENREDLQGAFIESVVRNGFGVMFPISRGEVSDKQLQTIIEFLAADE